ncbi:MAG TPA: MBL fold metallo-hydrolase [Flavitalea sp.]|nr:MBL fold metallo-hydrolase [Flavitalea sp.]
MSLYVTSLNSGSNGNCYYIGNREEAIIVDAGLSCRETEKRMSRLGLDMNTIKAIFISHEHSDHIFGLSVLSKKYQFPVFITERTRKNSGLNLQPHLVNSFHSSEPVHIGAITVHAFPKHHDAADPHSFIVSANGVKVGIFTDIGNACNNVIDSFTLCNAVFLESNYDDAMLMNGRYPYHLKQRIRGGKGHLSNKQAFELFTECRSPFMSHLVLSHLSRENNTHEIVDGMFQPHASTTHVVIASRYKETAVYEIPASPSAPVRFTERRCPVEQLSLF